MPHDPYRAMYVHIPFCVKRCAYCDFMSRALPVDSPEIDEYIENLILQIRRKSREEELGNIESIYIGGGTPTYIGLRRLSSLLYGISLSVITTRDDMEWTVEANPESLSDRMVKDMWAMGVNRLSIGVQSFDDELLNILGRAHDAAAAEKAIETAHERFTNVSVDLMCGIPGQTDDSLCASVKRAIELGVTHVSIYPLTIEDHTPFHNMVLAGTLAEPDEDTQARHMEIAAEELHAAGFARYEVASYARPGFESKHNSAYWTGVPYIGFGSSAATMTQNSERRMRIQDGHVTDDLNRAQMEAEDLMLGMRMSRGVTLERIEQARAYLPALDETLEKLIDDGLVRITENAVQPTNRGWLCGNELYEALFNLAP